MAQLIKINDNYINLSAVANIADTGENIIFWLNTDTRLDTPLIFDEPEELAALRRFLKAEAHDTIDWHRSALARETEEATREAERELLKTLREKYAEVITKLENQIHEEHPNARLAAVYMYINYVLLAWNDGQTELSYPEWEKQ